MAPRTDDYSYLTMTSGPRMGTNFLLLVDRKNRIGRGTDCEIVLTDPVCSRVHAELELRDDGWWLLDSGSRNGCYVNEERAEQVRLQDGSRLKFGASEFVFHLSDEPPTRTAVRSLDRSETVVKEAQVNTDDSSKILLTALENAEFAHDLLVIYQLSVKLLEYHEPDPVIATSLDLLHDRTKAAVVGFLWASDEGVLRPKLVLPRRDEDVSLSSDLTNVVCEQGRAVWISNQSSGPKSSLRKYSDAICVPLVKNKVTLGVLHLYLKNGRFRQADFDFSISVANLMSVALVRARQDASLAADHARLVVNSAASDELIGLSSVMLDLKSQIERIAHASGCVLIRGESGAGKELVARALHRASVRSDRPLLSVNCAAIPAPLVESQLFGHKKGAFTSAETDRVGWFQQADTGTLFLDEIGELPLEGQAKLLRILEGHPFQPVGAVEDVTVDVRVLAATNRDLKELVAQKRFREDLYYRLTVFELMIPPLRDRGEDIERLINHFFAHFRRLHGRPKLQLEPTARQRLLDYDWPGNVRQLRNVIDSAVVLATGDRIQAEDLGIQSAEISDQPTSLRIADWEKKLIQDALRRTQGKVPEAAKLLGIGRATLYRKIDEYDIPR
ncbi:MAG: sigma 54-interacting transcriptional regulator [Pirellulaceae bacterium]|nr:sigma 54-interacting transcriptional regulator [Pirellulaceae bacterium]